MAVSRIFRKSVKCRKLYGTGKYIFLIISSGDILSKKGIIRQFFCRLKKFDNCVENNLQKAVLKNFEIFEKIPI